MCGGIRFRYEASLDTALVEAYPAERLKQFRETGVVESLFWQGRPVLPAILDGKLQLYDWGNRDESLKLPKTGWLRVESLTEGKWNYLKPREVLIPALAGVEKKIWFTIEHGLRGFLVRRGDVERVYMLTLPPTPEYQALTKHDRMPALVDQAAVVPILP